MQQPPVEGQEDVPEEERPDASQEEMPRTDPYLMIQEVPQTQGEKREHPGPSVHGMGWLAVQDQPGHKFGEALLTNMSVEVFQDFLAVFGMSANDEAERIHALLLFGSSSLSIVARCCMRTSGSTTMCRKEGSNCTYRP